MNERHKKMSLIKTTLLVVGAALVWANIIVYRNIDPGFGSASGSRYGISYSMGLSHNNFYWNKVHSAVFYAGQGQVIRKVNPGIYKVTLESGQVIEIPYKEGEQCWVNKDGTYSFMQDRFTVHELTKFVKRDLKPGDPCLINKHNICSPEELRVFIKGL